VSIDVGVVIVIDPITYDVYIIIVGVCGVVVVDCVLCNCC